MSIDLSAVDPGVLKAIKAMRDAGVHTPTATLNAIKASSLGVVDHGQTYFYIPETGRPIQYEPFQAIILNIMAGSHSYPTLLEFYSTVEYSTVKKSGKALAVDTKIPTVQGWKDMADIQVGDQVFGSQGQPCVVTFATEIMTGHDCYKITFGDSSSIVADAEHLWQVTEVYGKHRTYIKSTETLAGKHKLSTGAPTWRIPIAGPLHLPEADLSIDPYVLGVWLGDGANDGATLTCADPQIIEEIVLAGVPVKPVAHLNRAPEYRLGSYGRSYIDRNMSLTAELRYQSLLNNKYIPTQYLRASALQRLALLQGLMDTDGTVSSDGKQCEFLVTHEPLAKGFLELVRSLGFKANIKTGRATLYGKDCGTKYRICFHAYAEIPVFRLDRKAARLQKRSSMAHENRSIASIEPVDTVPVKCIQVDSPDHLYLCTEALIPTHNTALSGAYARWRSESSTLADEILFFANDEGQSRGRGYEALKKSIELDPLYDQKKRELYDKDGNVVWRIIEDYLEHVPTRTKVKAVNVDYRGEAGANPTLTLWTEAWGYDTQKQELLFDEMTPVLTRERSQRYLEGYAGYTGRSIVQEKVEAMLTDTLKGGRQLTLDDIPDWPWPEEPDGLLPMWVNDQAGMFGYLDRGPRARLRMPWLQGERGDRYYREQQLTLHDPQQFDRLHNNYWISPVDAFIELEWWRQCADVSVGSLEPWRSPRDILEPPDIGDHEALARYLSPDNWAVTGEPVPVVLGADASVSGDCTALVGCTRHPTRHQDVALRMAWKWDPPRGSKIDYDLTPNQHTGLSLKQQLIWCCMTYNVVQLAYDEWQLHHLTNELRRDGIVWCRAFKQGTERDIADKQLYDLIKLRRISYDPHTSEGTLCMKDIESHIGGASRTVKPKEDTKLHIVKANSDKKIDLVIAISMSCAECLRLDL